MRYRAHSIRVDADTCHRLSRLQRGTGTPVRKIVNAVLRDYLDLPRRSRRPRKRR